VTVAVVVVGVGTVSSLLLSMGSALVATDETNKDVELMLRRLVLARAVEDTAAAAAAAAVVPVTAVRALDKVLANCNDGVLKAASDETACPRSSRATAWSASSVVGRSQ
jgi:hypothetical protein